MPVGPYLPGLIQVKPTWKDDASRSHLCVWWFKQSAISTPALTDLTAIQTAVDTALVNASTGWKVFGDATWSYTGSIVTDYSSSAGLQASNASFVAVPGAVSGSEAAAGLAVVVSKKVAQRYRGGHGRTYFPGVPTGRLFDAGHWTSATALQAAGAEQSVTSACLSLTGAQQCQEVVLRGRRGASPSLQTILFFTGQQLVGSQRRRTRKAAHH